MPQRRERLRQPLTVDDPEFREIVDQERRFAERANAPARAAQLDTLIDLQREILSALKGK